MTKLVRKLKQMAKKRAHRKSVQKRRVERAHRELQLQDEMKSARLESEVELEMNRIRSGAADGAGNANDEWQDEPTSPHAGSAGHGEPVSSITGASDRDIPIGQRKAVRVLGDIVLDAPSRKGKKQLSRKQMRRKAKMQQRGVDINDTLDKKWLQKKTRVKVRAQIRNEDLH